MQQAISDTEDQIAEAKLVLAKYHVSLEEMQEDLRASLQVQSKVAAELGKTVEDIEAALDPESADLPQQLLAAPELVVKAFLTLRDWRTDQQGRPDYEEFDMLGEADRANKRLRLDHEGSDITLMRESTEARGAGNSATVATTTQPESQSVFGTLDTVLDEATQSSPGETVPGTVAMPGDVDSASSFGPVRFSVSSRSCPWSGGQGTPYTPGDGRCS